MNEENETQKKHPSEIELASNFRFKQLAVADISNVSARSDLKRAREKEEENNNKF